jgi:hypothetical protein
MKFQVNSFYTFGEMARTKKSMKTNKGQKTQTVRNVEYRYLCTALLLNEIYHPMKFQVHSFYTLGEIARTKIKYEN